MADPTPSPALWPDPVNPEITVEELHALREAGPEASGPFRLIDCREEDEWRHCRIEGAELLPLSGFGETHAAALPDPAEKVVVYCHHGMRSGKAAAFLRAKGYGNVWSLAGGIEDWSVKIDPSVPRY